MSPEPGWPAVPPESLRPGGRVIWITGLSGAGKTTLAKALLPLLPQPRLLLDGDALREALALMGGGYDLESRKRLALTYSRLCRLTAEQGVTVVCATISMFHEVHQWNRENLPNYLEVYLDVPEETRLKRDDKNVYTTSSCVGRDFLPELPESPDIVIQASLAPGEAANIVLQFLIAKGDSPCQNSQ